MKYQDQEAWIIHESFDEGTNMNLLVSLVQFSFRKDSDGDRFPLPLRSGERGSALVELALALPVLMLMLTGIFSFSVALYQKLQLAEALSSGGRVLAASRGEADPCSTATAAIYAASPSLNPNSMTLTYRIGGVSYPAGTTSCPGPSGAANPNMTAGGSGQIIATYPCTLSVYGLNFASCSIGTQITENIQ